MQPLRHKSTSDGSEPEATDAARRTYGRNARKAAVDGVDHATNVNILRVRTRDGPLPESRHSQQGSQNLKVDDCNADFPDTR